jgi:HEAT repeat protein
MFDQRLWTALRAAHKRRHGRTSARSWALVSDQLHKLGDALGGRTVGDVPALIGLAGDVSLDVETRSAACWVLGRTGIRAALETLIAVAGDDTAALRIAAVEALGDLGDERALVILSRAASTDPDPEVRYAAVYSLQTVDTDASARVLLAVFDNHDELASVRGMAAESPANLGPIGRPAVLALRGAFAEPSVEIRFWSAYALGYLGTAEAVEDLERLVGDPAVVEPYGSVGDEARDAIETIRRFAEVE